MKSLILLGLATFALFPAHAQDDRPIISDRDAPKETVATNNLPTLWIAGDSTLRSNPPMRGWVEFCAKSEQAAYLDLAATIGNAYDKLDQSTVESYFADKATHTSAAGSLFIAKSVIACFHAIPTAPLDSFLTTQAKKFRRVARS